MNIRDAQFNRFINYTDNSSPHQDTARIAKYFAGILSDITKHKESSEDRTLWNSVPEIGADAKYLDIVKDYSIRHHHKGHLIGFVNGTAEYAELGGQVGIVMDTREIRKRDGRTAVQVEILFYNHTNTYSPKYRKLEFIKG